MFSHWLPWFLMGVGFLTLAGCGARSAPERALDPEAARDTLTDALDAWKAGEPYDSDRPIRVADEDWLAGTPLLDYQIEPGEWVVGADWHCPVTLTLADRQGRPRPKRVLYAISTNPSPSVIRQDVH